jgi:hypothetical protein
VESLIEREVIERDAQDPAEENATRPRFSSYVRYPVPSLMRSESV